MMDVATVPGYTSHAAEVDGVRLHYRLGGDPAGRPVLLWHGFLGTSYVWRKVMPALAAAGFAVLAPDMRGYGDSDKPEARPVTTPGHWRKSSVRWSEPSVSGVVPRSPW